MCRSIGEGGRRCTGGGRGSGHQPSASTVVETASGGSVAVLEAPVDPAAYLNDRGPAGLIRDPQGAYPGPWRQATYRVTDRAATEAAYAAEIAIGEREDPGFEVTPDGVVVRDPNRARYWLDGQYQVAVDNLDPNSGVRDRESRAMYRKRRDSLGKLMEAIQADKVRQSEAGD